MSHRRGNNTQSEIHRLMQEGVAIPAWRPDGDYSWFVGFLPKLHRQQKKVEDVTNPQMSLLCPSPANASATQQTEP